MSNKLTFSMIVFISALLGAIAAILFQQMHLRNGRSEMAAVSLSNHYGVIRQIELGNIPAAQKLLSTLADRDVIELLETQNASTTNERADLQQKLLMAYSQFRKRNPELYGIPGYVDAAGQAEYENNLARIQKFLEQASSR